MGEVYLWKVSIDGGEPVQITNKYSLAPAISPDGKLIACYYLDERTRMTKIALSRLQAANPSRFSNRNLSTPQPIQFAGSMTAGP